MITTDSIEQAYCFFHQKLRIYSYSTDDTQKDNIEYAIGSYVEKMNKELYLKLSGGKRRFLVNHQSFAKDLSSALDCLEKMMEQK